MAEYQPQTDRQIFYFTLLVAAAVLLWELLPFARAWITPYTFAIFCAPLWLNLALADTRRAYLTLALRGSILALVAALLLILQGAH
jgi:hypothetical protein